MALQKRLDETLTKVGVKYVQDPSNFVAGNLFPRCPVMKLSSTFPTYDKEYWFKDEAEERSPGTESAGGVHGRGTDSYDCKDMSFHEDVPFENIENDPEPLNPEKAATLRVTGKIALRDEREWSANFLTTSVWGTDATPTVGWGTPATAIPLNDVSDAKRAVKQATSFEPNVFVIGRTVFDKLKFCDQITDRLKYTSSQNVTEDILARMFEVDRVVVMNAVYDSAKYGATASMGFVAGDVGLLMHVTGAPSLEMPSAGYTFVWNGFGIQGYGVRRFWREEEMAWRVEAHNYRDMKKVAADLGYFFNGPVAGT